MTPDQQVEFEQYPQSLGSRLGEARRSAGKTTEQVASTLRVPVALVDAIERDDFGRLGAAVFARGHLLAYAKLIGVPAGEVDHALAGRVAPLPELVPLAPSTRLQRFADRAARRAVYVVLTSAIVLPVVWYATQPGLHDPKLALNSLDPPAQPGMVASALPIEAAPRASAPKAANDYPIVASLAPFYAKQPVAAPTESANSSLAADPRAGEDWLSLQLVAASWVEIYDTDGNKIEQALLPAGTERHYSAGQVGRITLGNANAVVVRQSGREIDFSAFRRANVARFTISSDGSLQPVGG